MELKKIDINGLNDIYAVDVFEKEFKKAVDESWKSDPPWKRYQTKLIKNLVVLDTEKEQAVRLKQFEKQSGTEELYSIRYPETNKNFRVIYTVYEENFIILLAAFQEKNDGDYRRAVAVAEKDFASLKIEKRKGDGYEYNG